MSTTNILLTELFGTALLIILGNGIVANVVLKNTKGNNAGWLSITMGWGFAVAIAALISSALGGVAHLNPAVTLAQAIADKTKNWGFITNGHGLTVEWLFFFVLAVQFIGAIIGQLIVDLVYYKHIQTTLLANDDFATSNVLGMHSTGPTTSNIFLNFAMEFLGTAVLILGILSIGKFQVGVVPAFAGPFLVGAIVLGIGLSLGGTTGYAINPFRDLGPRLVHQLLPMSGKGSSDWKYSWIPVVAPMSAGAIMGALFLI